MSKCALQQKAPGPRPQPVSELKSHLLLGLLARSHSRSCSKLLSRDFLVFRANYGTTSFRLPISHFLKRKQEKAGENPLM